MTRALLLDLDGTLLKNDLNTFTPIYFRALTEAVAPHVEAEAFLTALGAGVQAMLRSEDRSRSNAEVFWTEVEPRLPVSRSALEPALTRFYDEAFANLAHVTEPIAGAAELIAAARAAGIRLAVATNPIFPRRAIEHRIDWAGLDAADFDLITCYETMHSTKPHPGYFREILDLLGVRAGEALMAGNHLSDDIAGAQQAGLKTFLVDTFAIEDVKVVPDGRGSLDDLRRFVLSDA